MDLFKRPIANIKDVDFGAISWVVFWLGAILIWSIPVYMYADIKNAFSLMFSFELLEKVEVPQDSTFPTSFSETYGVNVKNTLITGINISKIVIWISLPILILRFLFKKPKNTN